MIQIFSSQQKVNLHGVCLVLVLVDLSFLNFSKQTRPSSVVDISENKSVSIKVIMSKMQVATFCFNNFNLDSM